MNRPPPPNLDSFVAPSSVETYSPPALPVTGYRDLDDAHGTLSMRLAELGAAVEHGSINDAVTSAVALLFELREDYAIEEALMFRTGYPEYARHQASHAVLEQTFSELSRSLRAASVGTPSPEARADLLALLNAGGRMLAAHIRGADLALTKYLLAGGRKSPLSGQA